MVPHVIASLRCWSADAVSGRCSASILVTNSSNYLIASCTAPKIVPTVCASGKYEYEHGTK
eukprot:36187-Chlamydomonas_euryale.AAC.3